MSDNFYEAVYSLLVLAMVGLIVWWMYSSAKALDRQDDDRYWR